MTKVWQERKQKEAEEQKKGKTSQMHVMDEQFGEL